jgi:hypothetical protein
MNKSVRRNEKITGAFFISATTTAIIGVLCYGPVLSSTEILESANAASTQIAWGVFFELILAVSNIGTGIMLYPRLKRLQCKLGTWVQPIQTVGGGFYIDWIAQHAQYREFE